MRSMSTLSNDDLRAYRSNIWKLYLFRFLMDFQLWWAIWVLYLTDLRGLSLSQVSVLEALFWGTAVLAEVPTGGVADRFGRRTSLALGGLCITAAVLTFGLATNYWILVVSYVAWAFGITFNSGAEQALMYESLKELGRENEFQQVAGRSGAVFSFAALAGGIAGALIASATNLSVPVIMSGAIAAPGILIALTMREPQLTEGEMRLDYGPLLRESARTAFRLPSVRAMLLLSALVTVFGMFAPMLFMQPFLHHHDVGTALVGVVQTPTRLAGMAGALVAYRATARMGMRGAFMTAPFIIAGSYLLLGGWDSVFAFVAFPAIALVSSMLLPPAADYINQRIPSNQRATILSLRTMVASLCAASLVPVMGIMADALSLQVMFLIAGCFAAVVLPLVLALWLRADAHEAASRASAPASQPTAAGS